MSFSTRNSPARRALVAMTAGLALAFAAACGDDDEPASESSASAEDSADAEDVTVIAKEYSFDLSATPAAETKSVTFDNQGKEFHVMILARLGEGFTLDEALKLEGEKGSATTVAEAEAEPGEKKTFEVKKPIEPGEYAMLCPIPSPDGPHYELGQLEEFEVQ